MSGLEALQWIRQSKFREMVVVMFSSSESVAYPDSRQWRHYKANELSFEFVGMGTLGRSSISDIAKYDIERDGRFGPGLGISYFPHRNIGIQGEAYHDSSRGDHHYIDAIGGHVVGRFPIGQSGAAPYIFGGVGRQFDPGIQWTWDAGPGIEWRFHAHIGFFMDGRFVWADKSREYGLGRVGIKLGF
ncbi:MAG TPA: hypothetical protein VGF13_01980 [Verrucomicrobiae bacterium]|jgi:hypothetical protein